MDKKDIIIILLILILLYFVYCNYNNKNINNENFTQTDNQDIIDNFNKSLETRVDLYLASRKDIRITESIKNLGLLADRIQNSDGNLVVPANVQIRGKLTVVNDEDEQEILSTDNNSLRVNNINVSNINAINDDININSQIISNDDINIMSGKELNLFDSNNDYLSRTSFYNNINETIINLHNETNINSNNSTPKKLIINYSYLNKDENYKFEFNEEDFKCKNIGSIDGKNHDINKKVFIIRKTGGQIVTHQDESNSVAAIVNAGRKYPLHDLEWNNDTNTNSPLVVWGNNLEKHNDTGLYFVTSHYGARWYLYY